VRDVYSITNQYESIAQDIIDDGLLDPEEDLLLAVKEINRAMSPDNDGVVVLKARANDQTSGSTVIGSPDDTTYTRLNTIEIYAAGATLNAEFDISGATLVEDGHIVTIAGPDMINVSDLSSSEEIWRSGSQICIIGDEICFLRNVTAIDSTTYQLHGLIRARIGTEKATHPIDTPVYIMPQSAYVPAAPSYLTRGSDIYVKSLPRTSKGALQPDEVSSVGISYSGGGYKPLEVTNLNTTNLSKHWLTGEDVFLRWSYRNYNGITGAGLILTGLAGIPEPVEGTFIVQILDGTTVVRTITDLTDPTYTYTNIDMLIDFGSEPASINVIVITTLNGIVSDDTQITIDRY